jgi:hypothetical protein
MGTDMGGTYVKTARAARNGIERRGKGREGPEWVGGNDKGTECWLWQCRAGNTHDAPGEDEESGWTGRGGWGQGRTEGGIRMEVFPLYRRGGWIKRVAEGGEDPGGGTVGLLSSPEASCPSTYFLTTIGTVSEITSARGCHGR